MKDKGGVQYCSYSSFNLLHNLKDSRLATFMFLAPERALVLEDLQFPFWVCLLCSHVKCLRV